MTAGSIFLLIPRGCILAMYLFFPYNDAEDHSSDTHSIILLCNL